MNDTKNNFPQGVPPLSSLYVYVAGSCNLACKHCWITPRFQRSGVEGGPFIKLEYIEKAITEGKVLGLRSIKLTGGEPTLHPQFRQLVTLIDDAKIDIMIETNGTLIDGELAQFLKSKSHIVFISISLDGVTEETHDALRNVSGSYTKAVSGIKSLVEVGFHPQMICTLHKGNVAEIDDLVQFANKLGCGSIKFNIVQQVGRGIKFQDDQGLEIEEIIKLYRYIEKQLTLRSHIPIHFDIPFAFRSLRYVMQNSGGTCAVKNILGLLAGGELALCGIGTTISELVYGHLETSNLQDVWRNSPGLARLREQIPSQLQGICGVCVHRNQCQGECVANNFNTSGRLDAPYYFCDQAETLGLFPASRKKQ